MNRRFAMALAISCAAVALSASPRSDREAVLALPRLFCEAWEKHDGHALASIMADDVEFVTVGATMLRGRADFEKYHARLLSGRFRDSTNVVRDSSVRFLRNDLAVVHWTWSIEGDKNADGSSRPKRFGLMTMIAEKRNGRWLVVAAQNTNAAATASPEAADITSPLPLPKQ